jgi:hypothetical protein
MEPYPVQFSVGEDNTVARWRPLVHWLLIIPHFLIWQALGSVVSLALVIVWFVVVFTGTLPAGLGNLTVMTLRYQNRMVAYLYGLTTSYPPFAFSDEANDPRDHDVVTDIDMQLEDRNRVTVFFRPVLTIPLLFVHYAYGVVTLCGIGPLAWFAVLFTGRYPSGLRTIAAGFFRFTARVMAYNYLLTDRYPPFSLTR